MNSDIKTDTSSEQIDSSKEKQLLEKLVLYNRLEYLIKLSFFDKHVPASMSDFERFLEMKNPQCDLRETLKFLISKGILVYYDNILQVKRYKINIRALRDFIDELPAIELMYDYFDIHHTIAW